MWTLGLTDCVCPHLANTAPIGQKADKQPKAKYFGTQSFSSRGTLALHLNEAADGSCRYAGLGLVWHCYWIYMSFVCLIPQKNICFGFLKGRGCVESKNKTSFKRKSTMSSFNPSIIQVGSFKCWADVPLYMYALFPAVNQFKLP